MVNYTLPAFQVKQNRKHRFTMNAPLKITLKRYKRIFYSTTRRYFHSLNLSLKINAGIIILNLLEKSLPANFAMLFATILCSPADIFNKSICISHDKLYIIESNKLDAELPSTH